MKWVKMQDLPLGERLTRIEDELNLVDSTLDATTLHLWKEIRRIDAELTELRNKVNAPATT